MIYLDSQGSWAVSGNFRVLKLSNLENFRVLKLSNLENFRALKLPDFESFRTLKSSNLANEL